MPDESERVAELLDHIQKGDTRCFEDFCKALKKSGQEHMTDLLCGIRVGGDTADAVLHDPDDMPLSCENSRYLTTNWNYLIDKLISDVTFMGRLESFEVFADLQIKKLKASNSIIQVQICCVFVI